MERSSLQQVTLSSTTSGAIFCYTTDGGAPACDPTKPISEMCVGTSVRYVTGAAPRISSVTTVRALACKAGSTTSSSVSASYSFRAALLVVSIGAGVVVWGTKPVVAVATTGATLLVAKTIDGTTPLDPAVASAGTCAPASGAVASSSLPIDIGHGTLRARHRRMERLERGEWRKFHRHRFVLGQHENVCLLRFR